MKTKNIFINKKLFYYRDSEIDSWFPEEQEATKGVISMVELKKEMTFQEMYDEFKGDTVSLVDIENLIKNEDSRLRTDGYANIFFVEDKEGNVSVVGVGRHVRQWYVYVCRLDYDGRWYVGRRVFVSNLKLGDSDPSPLKTRIEKLEEDMEKIKGIFNQTLK